MLFNSIEFLIFLPIVFYLYWFVFNKYLKLQNLLILICSYVFYGWWDWRFLILILLSTIVDYFAGIKIYNSIKNKKRYLIISIVFNLTVLLFFKYFNFFIDSWINILNSFGYKNYDLWTLEIILPVGISFYTFQTMSYSLDIYYKKLNPTYDFISFASFVSFFPQLVAGPIERASNLLPQILTHRTFKYKQGVQGLKLILWGMFKKVVIADSLAAYVDFIFTNFQSLDGGVLLLGLFYFSFQIYCDFSGYSDIAIGTAKLFGFELMSNFKFPYFSRNIGEFWRRWHISLSSWFRDYMYIPLGGSKKGKLLSIRNIFIIFLVSGFWHGSNWTFIIWGLLHAMLYIPFYLNASDKFDSNIIVSKNKRLPSIKEFIQIINTYILTMIIWVFFRSESVSNSIEYLYNMISKFSLPINNKGGLIYILILLSFDWTMRKDERNPINYNYSLNRFIVYILLSYLIFTHFKLIDLYQFIYFQF